MNKKKNFSYARYGYLFSVPFVVAFLIFQLYPTLYTAVIGFTDLKGIGKTDWHFLEKPFANFVTILTSPTFQTAFKNTIKLWVCNFIPQLALALLLAAWFTDRRFKIPGEGIFKVLFYMPNIITAATVAILFNALFGYPMGPVNDLMTRFGIFDSPYNFLVKKNIAQDIVIFIQTWMWYGYTMIILISGVLGISPEIFEAAEVDGANGWQTFWQVTIPNIKTILLFTLVTSLIGGLNMFDIPRLFLMGGPDNATLTTSVFIYNLAFSGSYLYNRAAAASMLMFVLICLSSALLFYALRDRDEAKLEKIVKQQIKEEKRRQKEAAKS
ncbi:MAG: sugar ABC transporter permease [Lachnospiraceae bacterium]|nr:sugar ABC transporter permease [Lachnospiraceae bacterium]MBQ6364296.1 sugar ABC transporter permease [Lachnospiraceae bacterium]MBR2995583.1 sugar ABC transporter permease [Lachnospiraceae bacterium]